ncbi:single-stranded DNA-binding protein [Nocardia sp. NBC_01503]|uniref:single-stranded DNA-binding protein n=1 Tax=Nocardia sp. NBC_01503 TaxID=2975997 RepID=UPI002E7B27E4|nr:single-stranded DNA-binding protein [Nocardia sp. NBC_01503]WTL30147.1 single-stranded DNA-binding protein [Nocardia sp. NBC_01503]
MSGETTLTVIGNLTSDPVIRTIPKTNDSVVNFTVASTPRVFDRQANQWKDGAPLFMRCTMFRDAADNIADSLVKGARVVVVGKLQQREYTDREGVKRQVIELVADEVGASLKYAVAKPIRRSASNGRNSRAQAGAGHGGGSSVASDDPYTQIQSDPEEVA